MGRVAIYKLHAFKRRREEKEIFGGCQGHKREISFQTLI